jgi:hypothetical protein
MMTRTQKVEPTYRITVKPLTSTKCITFSGVEEYGVVDGYLTFEDSKTGDICRFAVSNTEIKVENPHCEEHCFAEEPEGMLCMWCGEQEED